MLDYIRIAETSPSGPEIAKTLRSAHRGSRQVVGNFAAVRAAAARLSPKGEWTDSTKLLEAYLGEKLEEPYRHVGRKMFVIYLRCLEVLGEIECHRVGRGRNGHALMVRRKVMP